MTDLMPDTVVVVWFYDVVDSYDIGAEDSPLINDEAIIWHEQLKCTICYYLAPVMHMTNVIPL